MRKPLLGTLVTTLTLLLLGGITPSVSEDTAFLDSQLIFPLEHWHNHSSSIVELPDGDLLVVWFHGSGERTADDVVLLGSRKPSGSSVWTEPFLMEDVPGFPDTNCVLFLDPNERLWLIWPTILANEWDTALLKYRISTRYQGEGAPVWEISRVLHLKPGEKFVTTVDQRLREIVAGGLPDVEPERIQRYIQQNQENARDKLFRRLGWMTRTHPVALDGRILVPLYSDGFSFSLIAYTDDDGKNWQTSTPIVGVGNIQPTLALRNNGTLVAYMRDNGPAPKRLHYSESRDRGETWGVVIDTEIPNPGSSAEVLVLESGNWILVHNDLEQGRYQLAVALSDDEGRTWRWKRYLERDRNVTEPREAGQYHYPSVIQAKDGSIHVTYSYFLAESQATRDQEGRSIRKSIKHARLNEAWIKSSKREE